MELNKPIYISVLAFWNYLNFTYQFYYDVMKKYNDEIQQLYTVTGSFISILKQKVYTHILTIWKSIWILVVMINDTLVMITLTKKCWVNLRMDMMDNIYTTHRIKTTNALL